MHISFLNPQGNFDPDDRYWTEHPDFGGQLVYVKEVALQLGAMGHKVDVLTRRIDDSDWPEFSSQLARWEGHENVRIVRLPCGPPTFLEKENLWPYIAEWAEAIEEFYQEEGSQPGVHTAHYADGGLAGVLLKEATGVPFTFTAHSLGAQKLDKFVDEDSDFDAAVERFRFDHRIAAERAAMARAGIVITSTEEERRDQYGAAVYKGAIDSAEDSKFRVIPPGVNLKVFGEDVVNDVEDDVQTHIEERIRRDIPAPRRHLPIVVCSSRLDPKKNIIGLVRAWAENENLKGSANLAISLRGHDNPFRAPEGTFAPKQEELLDEIRTLLDERNLWPCVLTLQLNSQAELAAAYRHISDMHWGVFALTTYHEPFGLAPLEAMAAGLPAVATKNGGPSESLANEYGVLVDPMDPDDIASGILKLVKRRDVWNQFHDAGLARVQEHYTWEKVAEKYLEAIETVHAGNGSPNDEFDRAQAFTNPKATDISPQWLKGLWKKGR